MWKVLLITLPRAGCVTTDDRGLAVMLADRDRTVRSDLDAVLAELVCKQNARTLVQIARCTR